METEAVRSVINDEFPKRAEDSHDMCGGIKRESEVQLQCVVDISSNLATDLR